MNLFLHLFLDALFVVTGIYIALRSRHMDMTLRQLNQSIDIARAVRDQLRDHLVELTGHPNGPYRTLAAPVNAEPGDQPDLVLDAIDGEIRVLREKISDGHIYKREMGTTIEWLQAMVKRREARADELKAREPAHVPAVAKELT